MTESSLEQTIWNRLTAGAAGQMLVTIVEGQFPEWISSGTPSPHAASHENGGSDEINVAGLSGLLADAQTPRATVIPIIALAAPMAF